ncbi:hypothetical protein [uncultured Variovorax sp.]|uniref:hypothetical protein n=1 Tax=uncultured Variovorax sp. TaxID=114708 RepID=UPI0025DE5FA6|nr:hypothetical protein [uncultured Variovorax sp.]
MNVLPSLAARTARPDRHGPGRHDLCHAMALAIEALLERTAGAADDPAAALDTSCRQIRDDAGHGDFFMEREADVLRAIKFMTWA